MKRHLVVALASALLVGLFAADAPAQKPTRYTPKRPTLSPYLKYFQQGAGLTDSYHAFVRPDIALSNRLGQQQSEINRNAGQIGQIQQRPPGVASENVRPAGIAPTGTGAGFMNLSHFFGGGGRK